jgi:4-oxalocrotonate tautomerase
MPVIRVEMFEGRTADQKRALVKALTDAFVETAGGRRESIQVVLTDVAPENWATGGTLFSDK